MGGEKKSANNLLFYTHWQKIVVYNIVQESQQPSSSGCWLRDPTRFPLFPLPPAEISGVLSDETVLGASLPTDIAASLSLGLACSVEWGGCCVAGEGFTEEIALGGR
mgnify:CR=1 FL=1